jgi:hypothetical protein
MSSSASSYSCHVAPSFGSGGDCGHVCEAEVKTAAKLFATERRRTHEELIEPSVFMKLSLEHIGALGNCERSLL